MLKSKNTLQIMTTDKQNELLIEVDENNDIVGPITRGEAHNGSNRIYRTIFILLKNKDNRFLIQKRSGTKDLFPNCWDLNVGGHVLWKDEYLTSAIRELEEELGIKAKDDEMKFLAEVPVSLPSSREIFHVFEYNLKESDKIKLEVS